MGPLQTATLFGLQPEVYLNANSAAEAVTTVDPLDSDDLAAVAAALHETLPDQSTKLRQLLEGRGEGPQVKARLRAELKKMILQAGPQWVQIAKAALLHRTKVATKKPTWKSDDQFRAAWNLYKELGKLWPARGEENPTDEFKIFQARYRSAEGYGRYLQELGDLALNSYLDFLLGEATLETSQKHFYPVHAALRKKPDLNRLVWQTIFSKIPEWDPSLLPFDPQKTFDDWARTLQTFKKREPVAAILAGRSLFDFQMGLESAILALAALEFQKQRLLEKSGRAELSMREILYLEAGLKNTLAAAIPNIFSSAFGFLAAVEPNPFSNPSFKSLLSLLNDWLHRALPNIQSTSERTAEVQTIKEALYRHGRKAILMEKRVSSEEIAREFSQIMREITLEETVLFLRLLSDGSLEGELHQEAILLLQEIMEISYDKYLAGARERADQLRSLFPAQDSPWPKDLNLDFIHALAPLTSLFLKHPFSLSREGWTPLDRTKTGVLEIWLDFACSKLAGAKLELEMAGHADLFRTLFREGGNCRLKFEGEVRRFQQALIQVEGKERELSADHPGQPYLRKAKEMLYKLREVINETTGLWEMRQ